jgi:hypothetical protein
MCEREWEVFFKLEMEFGLCSCVGREVGVSIYRWGSKTSCFHFFAQNRLNLFWGAVEPPLPGQADCLPV